MNAHGAAHLPVDLYTATGLTPGAEYRLSFAYTLADGSSESGNTSPAKAGTDGKLAFPTALVLPVVLGAVDAGSDHHGGTLTLAAVNAADLSPLAPAYTKTIPVA